MATNKPNNVLVQAYDVDYVRVYYKIHSGFFFTSKEEVYKEKIESELAVSITCDRLPDRLTINGKEYVFTEKLSPV